MNKTLANTAETGIHGPPAHGFDTAFYAVPDPGPPSYFSPYGVHKEGEASGRQRVGTIQDWRKWADGKPPTNNAPLLAFILFEDRDLA